MNPKKKFVYSFKIQTRFVKDSCKDSKGKECQLERNNEGYIHDCLTDRQNMFVTNNTLFPFLPFQSKS